MADLYQTDPTTHYYNDGKPNGTPVNSGNKQTDDVLANLSDEERQQAEQILNAPMTGDEISEMLKNRRETGYVPTEEEYKTYAEWSKTQEHSILEGIAQGFSGVMHQFGEAGGQFVKHPLDTAEKLPASVAEAFFQGTRNFYGMLAQSEDPNSVLFRFKNAIAGDGSTDAYNQFLEALKFGDHSADLAEGKTTLLMDKDAINHEVTQAASYIADPTLFIPYVGEVSGLSHAMSAGMRATMMGEKLAGLSMRAGEISNKVLAGGLRWGVGTPLEFMGGAVRGTIDYATHIGGTAFEATTGVGVNEFKATAKLTGLGSSALGVAGHGVPVLSDISNAYIAGTSARGLGEAVNAIAGQIDKQAAFGRGINSYARQALIDTEKAGIQLSPHAKSLLKILDAVDPLFAYGSSIAGGAAHGAVIGGGLGYLSGGQEGLGHGIGAGIALGGVGAGVGKVVSDVTGATGVNRRAIQSEMVLKGYEARGEMEKVRFWKELRLRSPDPDMVNAIIAGIDNVSPLHEIHAMSPDQFKAWSKENGYDAHTGQFSETSRIIDSIDNRSHKGEVLGILRDNGDKFAGDSKAFVEDLKTNKSMKIRWDKLTEEQKSVVLKGIDAHADFIKEHGTGKLKDYYADHAAAEKYTNQINELHSKSPEAARKQIEAWISGHKDAKGELTQRGRLLVDKLRNEGYLDKDGTILTKRGIKNSDITLKQFQSIAGMVTRREADGKVHIYINTKNMDRSTLPHELFHAIMKESPMKQEFIDRLIHGMLGKYDNFGRVIEAGSVHPDELKKFFERYIESENRNESPETIKALKDRLNDSINEFKNRGKGERVDIRTATPLEHYAEEFGAYYFANFLLGKNRDFLFHGGELHGIAGLLDSAKTAWLNFWGSKIGSASGFNFSNIQGYKISEAFNGKRNAAFDAFMTDFIKANSMINRGGFDINRLSPEAQAHFLEANGIMGFGARDKNGQVRKFRSTQQAVAEQVRIGKEIYKILNGLDPELRKNGTVTDGEGNISGRPNQAEVDAIVKSGFVPRAWIDKVVRGYDILEGNGGNLIDFGYQGRTAQIGDYAWPRLVGSDVPFKHRTAILIGVDFKVGADGKMYSLFHTLDKKVIESRANNLWADPRNRELWNGDRGAMEADFFKYLSNASKASGDVSRKPSHLILDHGDGKGVLRRNTLHQMLGLAKDSNEVYINKPTAEIPFGIRHSLTTFNVDGISNLRVDNGVRWDYNHDNAHKDLSRNFMPSEMSSEETPNGRIIKHATGYRILELQGQKYSVIDPEGKPVGKYGSLPEAGRAAQAHFNETFDNSVEGKDKEVPNTEIPPSRQAYANKRAWELLDEKALQAKVENALLRDIANTERQASKHPNINESNFPDTIERFKKKLKLVQEKGLKRAMIEDNVDIFVRDDATGKMSLASELERKAYIASEKEYDNMYPMEIKSGLHPRLAQIFQDYPELTAQGLLKKLEKYGSGGYRYLQEATEIGLVDLLKSKIKRTTSPMMLDGRVIQMPRGGEVQPKLNMAEILDFAKSKEIKVTIEEGAREVNNMDTSKFTLGGTKDNYKQTAIRINPEYEHGIRGHYGKNTIVHFRTTERLDAEGNRHLFIEEVQANNTDKKTAITEIELKRLEQDKLRLPILQRFRQEGIDRGLYINDPYFTEYGGMTPTLVSKVRAFFIESERASDTGAILNAFKNAKENYAKILKDAGYTGDIEVVNMLVDAYFQTVLSEYYDTIKKQYEEIRISEEHLPNSPSYRASLEHSIKTSKERIENIRQEIINSYQFRLSKGTLVKENSKLPMVADAILSVPELKKYFEDARDIAKRITDFEAHLKLVSKQNNLSNNSVYAMNPHHLEGDIADINTRILQANAVEKPLPMTTVKDWGLTALKGIIRQAIRDGRDNITLTHPDDSPTVSHMAKDARYGLYGDILPKLWGSWLKKYGIEIKQTNKLANAGIDSAKAKMAEVTNKLHDANKAVLEHFETVKEGEDPQVINKLAELMSSPVHEVDNKIGSRINIEALKVNDDKLRTLIGEVALLKGTERDAYNKVQKLREGGVRADLTLKSDTDAGISAEAIDRGMTFQLNDRIKREFLEGQIQTHAMPSEGRDPYEGGRTYNQNSKEWKAGFVGLYAENNPDIIKGINLQFLKKDDGSWRIRLTDNSRKGESADIGHITASISGDTATLSSHINKEYRGRKLAYVVYSEMAERLRAMGIEKVDGQIVNPDGVPVHVREQIIGDTRDSFTGKPISRLEASTKIQQRQALMGNMAGVDVENRLYKQGRYQPSEEVIKRAREEGYTILGQHKTNNEFNVFDINAKKVNRGLNPAGHYFTTTKNDYKGSRTINAFLKLENPWNGTASSADKKAFKSWFKQRFANQYEGASDVHIAYLDGKMNQFVRDGSFPTLMDGNDVTSFLKSRGYDGWKDGSDVAVFDSSQIKLADDKTFDDQGNEIPLSKRFDKTNKDIRYQPAEEEKAPVKWVPQTYELPWNKKEGKGMEVVWMKASRFLNLASKFDEKFKQTEYHKLSLKAVRDRMQKGLELDRPQLFVSNFFGEPDKWVIEGHEGRHRSSAVMELYGDKYIPVEVTYNSDYYEGENLRDVETNKVLNQDRTGRYMPAEENPIQDIDFDELIKLSKKEKEENGRGKQYSPEQLSFSFIGRYSQENPRIIKDKKLFYSGTGYTRSLILKDSETGYTIGFISLLTHDDVNKSAYIQIAEVFDKGKNYGTLLYSELAERLRSEGYTSLDGRIVDPEGRPLKIRKKIIDEENERIGKETSKTIGGKTYSPLYTEAHYQPSEENSYRGMHKAPSGENGEGSLDAMDRTYPSDIYSPQGARYYGSGQPKLDKQMHELILKFKGNPDAIVTVYRAVPKGKSKSINEGDWVTPLRAYAFVHGERWHEGADIIEKKVRAGDLFTEGNSIYEFGWNPKSKPKGSFQPAEKWTSDQSTAGKIMSSVSGFVIMQSGTKFRLYNPYKALVGVYNNIDQAKNKVEKSIQR